MKNWFLVFMLSVAGLCGQEVRRAEPVVYASENEVALFLAGVLLPETSSLAALQKTPLYAEHISALAKLSQHYDRNYFSKMRAWSAAELAPRLAMTRPVYYFFGGPDAVSPLALFPQAPVFILGGLEPVGSIAPLQSLSPEALAEALGNLRKSAEVVLSYGHFITKDMKSELDRTAFRGVLPLIYVFLALSGNEVLSTAYIGIGRDGGLQEFGPAYAGGSGVLPGVKVVFRNASGGSQAIYYVQANVADDALKSNNALLAWAGRFGEGNVYLKAASYLLHEPYFSRMRNFLLSNAAVLQDDSGVPFRYFREGGWRCWFFGS